MKLTSQKLKDLITEVMSETPLFRTSKSSYFMHRLDETTMTGLQGKYMEAGFIVITPDRTCQAELGLAYGEPCPPGAAEEQARVNEQNRETMKQEIRAAGFGYTPVMGGYKEKLVDPDTGAESRVDTNEPESGFLIMAQPGRPGLGIEELRELGMQLASKYNQDSFFFKPPNAESTDAFYLMRDGSIDMTFHDFKFGDLDQEFYTQLAKGKEQRQPEKRFSAIMESMLVPVPPRNATEARSRRGEYFMPRKSSK
jgi:hypothetical protein